MFDPLQKRTRYLIDGFGPKLNFGPGSMHEYAFSVNLQKTFAQELLVTPIPKVGLENFDKKARAVTKRMGLKGMIGDYPYHFADVPDSEGVKSCLLRICSVPGNATELSLDVDMYQDLLKGKDLDRKWLRYNPHNIDTLQQASALLANWLDWANLIEFALPEK